MESEHIWMFEVPNLKNDFLGTPGFGKSENFCEKKCVCLKKDGVPFKTAMQKSMRKVPVLDSTTKLNGYVSK